MKTWVYILILLSFLPLAPRCQSGYLLLGHQEFKKLNYTRAIIAYETASDKNLRAYRNLAKCYMAIGDWDHARHCLELVCDNDQSRIEDVWGLAQTHLRNGEMEAANIVLETLYRRAPRDARARAYHNAGDYTSYFSRNKEKVAIKYQPFNSLEQDFGLAWHGQDLVFASTRHPFSLFVKEWNGNQRSFLSLYAVNPFAKRAKPKYFNRKLNGPLHEGPIAFDGEGNFCALTSSQHKSPDESGVRNLGLYFSHFANGIWEPPSAFAYNDSTYSVGQASLNKNGDVMYFVSDMPGGLGGTDIYHTVLKDGIWQKPKPVYSINTEGNEMFPFYLEELGILLFASDGHVGLGGLDLFAAKQRGDRFFKIRNLGMPINSSSDDFGILIDDQMQTGYFSSNRPAPYSARKRYRNQDTLALVDDDDIYSLEFLEPFSFGKTISGVAVDDDGNPIEDAELTLSLDGRVVKKTMTAENGQFEMNTDSTGNYVLTGTKDQYFDGTETFYLREDNEEYSAKIRMKRDPNISIRLVVTDSEIGAPISGVSLTILDMLTGESQQYITPKNGEFFQLLPQKRLRDSIAFQFTLQLQDHLTKTIHFCRSLDHFGNYEVHKAKDNGRYLDCSMRKKTINDDLALQLGILPYFFESGNNATLSAHAYVDLDIVARSLLDNPSLKIEVINHTDCRGTAEANLLLSEKRAKAIAEYLVGKVPNGKSRITSKGAGERVSKSGCTCEGRYNSNCTEKEYQIDRRTEFIIKGI